MKNAFVILVMFFTLLFLTPFLWSKAQFWEINASSDFELTENFRLKLTNSGETIEISAVDYVIGCLYAQIPPGYHTEALKAQATAAYTYALRLAKNNADSGESSDLSDDSVTCQPYFTEEKAREYYGSEYDVYYEKFKQAAEYGTKHVILYDGEPIYAVYHSVSAGATNSARNVWSVEFPYLKSVSSEWDKEYSNFDCTNEITADDMRKTLLAYNPDIIMPLDYNRWFSDYTCDSFGYVNSINAVNMTLSGGDLWRILNLRSASFKITYSGSVFQISTKGHGHGVGLSQFGADYMARKGYTCEEILCYYYTGAVLASA